MDFSFKDMSRMNRMLNDAESYLTTKPEIAAEKAEKARQLCCAIKSCLKRIDADLRLYPAEWQGVSAQAHRQFCAEIISESNENDEELGICIEKLNVLIQLYGEVENETETGVDLPSSIL